MCFFTIYNELFVVVIAVSIGTPTILVLLFVADFSARWIAIYDYALTFANAVTRNLFGGGGLPEVIITPTISYYFFPKSLGIL